MNEPSSSRHQKEKKGSDEDSSDEGGFCFAFPGQEDSPRKPPRKKQERPKERNGDTKDVVCYSDKYNERLLDWGGGWDWDADESGVESVAEGKRGGWSSQREKEEFNKYLEELLEKEDFEKLKQQEEEIQNLKKEIEKYKKTDENSTENKGKKKRRPKKSRSIEREKKKKEKVHVRNKSESDKASPPIEKREAIDLSEKEKALLEYKKAIAAKYARIRTDVKDHRSQMILDYYSDRLSRRLATNQANAIADHVPEPQPEKEPEGVVPPLKLNRLPNAKETLNKPTRSSDDVSHSMRRSKLASEAYKRRSMQYGSELDASDPGATESLRMIPISFQEKKEEEKRYCVVLGDRFCGKTSLLDAVCVPRASREKYDKDMRKAMKGSWFKRGNSLKKSGTLRKKDHTIRFEDSNGKMRTLVFFDIPESGPDAEAKRKDAIEKADICLLCYPIDDDSALDRLKEQWIPDIQKVEPPLPIVLVGTRADMRLNSVSKVSGGGSSKTKASKEEPADDGDLDEFKGLRLSQQLQLNGYVECSILFRKTLDRFLQYVSSVISETETSMGGG